MARPNRSLPIVMEDSNQQSFQVQGIFDPQDNKSGSLLDPLRGGKTHPSDPFVPRELIRRFKIRRGSWVVAQAQRDERYPNPKVKFVETIDGMSPEDRKRMPEFSQLLTITPNKWLKVEKKDGAMTTRVMDIFCPIGKGQRGLIVAPPRTGKTTLLRDIALGVLENNKECEVMMLLVDERPEEVTDLRRSLPCRVFASSNDEDVQSHLRVAELTIEYAKRLVEAKKDVVILMDSLTRLARAYNSAKAGSGRTMSGGLDIRALEKPRQIFSAARNTEDGGSLTIIASALIETGSRMDDLIFQEFKGTGNMEMVLDRKAADLRLWPAINIASSGTRKEELLLEPKLLEKCHFFRRALATMKIEDACETAIERLAKTKTNAQFFALINI
jgi:transcription termination factor Rho